MNHKLFASTMGALALVTGAAWTPFSAAQAMSFTPPPGNSAPSTSTGGASRGSFGFTPPRDNAAPRTSTGGASRTGFTPPTDNAAPQTTTGGASRTGFTPPTDNAAPRTSTGGASRTGFTPPTDNPTPRQSMGGASRTNLYGHLPNTRDSEAMSLVAVIPDSFYGTTLAARPTILVYLPPSNASEAVFSLKDENENMIYQTIVPLAGETGVVAVKLPEDAPELQVNQNYQWFFALKLDGTLSPSTPYVDAWIKRIEPTADLGRSLAQSEPLKQAEILATQGVWYDSAATLAALRMAQPTDTSLANDWQELLTSVGLGEVAAGSSTSNVAIPAN